MRIGKIKFEDIKYLIELRHDIKVGAGAIMKKWGNDYLIRGYFIGYNEDYTIKQYFEFYYNRDLDELSISCEV